MKHLVLGMLSFFVLGWLIAGGLASSEVTASSARLAAPLWQDAARQSTETQPTQNSRNIILNRPALDSLLATSSTINLPLPDGGSSAFSLNESPIFEPAFSKRHPEYRSYQLVSIDDPFVRGRMVQLPSGLHALIKHKGRAIVIDPASSMPDNRLHVSYYQDELQASLTFEEKLFGTIESYGIDSSRSQASNFTTLRSYRIAIAADGEWTQQQGGTVTSTLSAIVSRLNDINLIYESELGIRLLLVADNHKIIFTDPVNDPYDIGSESLIETNKTVLSAEIGNNNYDVGHLFTGQALNSGQARIGAVCLADKGAGYSGNGNLRIALHELGHQFDARHSMNGNASFCGNARNGGSAYEPGSGTTIMSYSEVCAEQDIGSPDNYFGLDAVLTIDRYVTIDEGATCGTEVVSGNQVPQIDMVSAEIHIPAHTPFTLVGSASDPDNHPVQFSWQQYDLGPAGHPNQPSGNAPLFRVLPPSSTPTRTFPALNDILDNHQRIGELLPAYSRDVRMRLIVRDNQLPQGLATSDVLLHVNDDAGPLRVLQPDRTVQTWTSGSTETILWDVANTDVAPISCGQVNIDLSVDGGQHFDLSLADGVANDGSHDVTVPNATATQARLRIACASHPDHFFFAIADAEFAVTTTRTEEESLTTATQTGSGCPSGSSPAPEPLSPATTAFWESTQPTFSWLPTSAANIFYVQVSRDPTFAQGVANFRPISATSYRLPAERNLTYETTYYWRVRVDDSCGGGAWSTYQQFRTWRPELAADTIDGLTLWLDGNDVNADFSADTTHYVLLSSWIDKSATASSADSATPAYAGQQPDGGLGQVELMGQAYLLTDSVTTLSAIESPTIYAVLAPEPQSDGSLLALSNSSTLTDSVYLGLFGDGAEIGVSATISASGQFSSNSVRLSTPLERSDEWLLVGYSASSTPAANGDRSQLTLFGQDVAGDSQQVGLAASGLDQVTVGGISADIGDIIIFDRQLSAGEQAQIEGYLAHKWRLAEQLPSGHAYATAPPNFSNNQPPVVITATFSAEEFLPVGAFIGNVPINEVAAPLSYAIAQGNSDNAFSVSNDGRLTVVNPLALDFDRRQRFTLTVDVTNTQAPARTGSAVIVIDIIETNTPPVVTVAPLVIDSFLPTGTLVSSIDAFDYNVEDTLTFSIVGGNDDGAFVLAPLSGQLTIFDNAGFVSPAVQTRTLIVAVADDGVPQQVETVSIPITTTRCIVTTVVSVSADSGPCSLRQAILDAPAKSLISFHPVLSNTTIHLTAPLVITKSLTIAGNNVLSLSGDSDMDGNGDRRIFTVDSDRNVTLRNISLVNGWSSGTRGAAIRKLGSGNLTLQNCLLRDNFNSNGGAALFAHGGMVTIDRCSFVDNSADFNGSAIYQCNSPITIVDSSFIGNSSTHSGAAVHQACDAPLAITNSSFYGNVSADNGGALNIKYSASITNSTLYSNTASTGGALSLASSGTLALYNSILAGSSTGTDCDIASGGQLAVNSHNLIADGSCMMNATNVLTGTAQLLLPQDNGGPTLTLALASASPARNAGSVSHCPATDQRGFLRSAGNCDIGAYDFSAITTAVRIKQQQPSSHSLPVVMTLTLLLGLLLATASQIIHKRSQKHSSAGS